MSDFTDEQIDKALRTMVAAYDMMLRYPVEPYRRPSGAETIAAVEARAARRERERCVAIVRDYWGACGGLVDSHNGASLAFNEIAARIGDHQ